MQRRNRLNAMKVSKTNAPGFYADGGNLYLQIGRSGGKSWIFRYQIGGKSHDIGLGSSRDVALAEARTRAEEYRQLCSQGIDPLDARRHKEVAEANAIEQSLAEPPITFEQCAREYVDARRSSWKSEKSAPQWESSLKTYAYPVIGHLPVKDVTTQLVLNVLEPIWKSKYETASRLRGRIEAILDWAIAKDYRGGDNPAAWQGKIKVVLSAQTARREARHHNALPYADVPEFLAELRAKGGMASKALELVILTATRRRETVDAQWQEFDFVNRIWTIPASRMKVGKEHRVPLSEPAIELLRALAKDKYGELIFPNVNTGAPLSDMAISNLLKRMNRTNITTHGFRSSFRDWVSEKSEFSGEVAEMALAHSIENKVEAAYRRGDLFEKRRELMEAWGRYCNKPRSDAEVVLIRQRAQSSAEAA